MLQNLLAKIRALGTGAQPETEERLVPLAAATLLLEVAWADHDISDSELAVVRTALIGIFELPEVDVDELIEESRNEHDQSVGLHAFTRTLVDSWDEPKRFDLLVQLWRLALSDTVLDRFEEHTIRKIAELLYVSHPRFIEAKRQARRLSGEAE